MSSEGFDPAASGSADALIGQVIDKRYRVTAKLGEGGMGEVYAVDHLRIQRRFALKLLRTEVMANEEAVKRFEQEAMTASSIGHKNIIRIEDSGQLEDGRIFLTMEFLEGQPFNELIQNSLPPERLLHILIQTGHGLAAAHDNGIVHRDMKPENIYVTTGPDGRDLPKLLDFGIAKVSQADGENHLTRTGTIFGTPFYMAPEQALGQSVDHRADIYAMGIILYEVFCGAVPFQGESFMGILTQHITAEATPPSEAAAQHNQPPLLPGVEEVILRAIKKDPQERYQTMNELVRDLVAIYQATVGAPLPQTAPGPAALSPVGVHGHSLTPTDSQPWSQGEVSASHAWSPGASSSLPLDRPVKGRGGLFALALVAVLAAVVGVVFAVGGFGSESKGAASKSAAKRSKAKKPVVLAVVADAAVSQAAKQDKSDAQAAPTDARVVPDAAKPVVPKKIPVLLDSEPPRATVYIKGKRVGRAPMLLKVDPNNPTTVVLKARRHKDQEVTLDGEQEKVTGLLVAKGRSTTIPKTPTDPPDKDPASEDPPIEDPVSEDPPKKDPPKKDPPKKDPPKKDPPKKNPCDINPDLPECWLE